VHADLDTERIARHALAQIVIRHADSVRVVSEKIKNQIVHPHTHVLPVYIDVERFKKVDRLSERANTILWIGRFEKEKDPLHALEILKAVRASGIDAKLIMLGSGALEIPLKNAAEGLPVQFPGWHDTAKYLAYADVVLCTSRHESYGASIVEALAAGVPVVAPDVGVAKEAGALVVARDELAQATIEVLRSEVRGELALPVLSAEEWVHRWRESLV
jgi:glycosyltransferase involved in cell wall biosynthesis